MFTGRMTCRRFIVEGEVPDNYHATFERMLNELGFREPPDIGGTSQEVEGWVRRDNVMDSDFSADPNAWSLSDYLVFSLRIDKRTIPPKLLAARVKARAMAWAEDNGTERCPASIMTEIREAEKEALLRRALPKMKIIEVAWNISSGYVLISTTADAHCDRFRKRFFRTFGLKVHPCNPVKHWVPEPLSEALLISTEALATREFLTWFWWHSEEHSNLWEFDDGQRLDGWVDGRVALSSPFAQSDKAVLSGDNPSVAPEARAALSGGKTTIELMIGLRTEDREYTITLKGPFLDMCNAKLPVLLEEGDGEDHFIYDRMHLYEEVFGLITALFDAFARLRTSSAWDREILPVMRDWIDSPAPLTGN